MTYTTLLEAHFQRNRTTYIAGANLSPADFFVTAAFYSYCFNDNLVPLGLMIKFRESLKTKLLLVTWLDHMTQ